MKAHIEVDRQCHTQAEEAGLDVENITVADIAYPLVTKRVLDVFQQHVHNGCISNDTDSLPYVKVGCIIFHSMGYHLDHYYTQRGIGAEVFDAQLGWWIQGYNCRRMHALGKTMPPDSMSPKVFEC